MNKLLDNYQKAEQALYDHVGFKEDWVIYPIRDSTDMFWSIEGDEVKYAEDMDRFESDGNYYVDEIYTQRFYKKWVYRGEDLTMIFCDTHTDGMKYFAFFDNNKEIT